MLQLLADLFVMAIASPVKQPDLVHLMLLKIAKTHAQEVATIMSAAQELEIAKELAQAYVLRLSLAQILLEAAYLNAVLLALMTLAPITAELAKLFARAPADLIQNIFAQGQLDHALTPAQ
jgi:hypothetical protein